MADLLRNADLVVSLTQAGLNQQLARFFCAQQVLPDIGWTEVGTDGPATVSAWPGLNAVSLATHGLQDQISLIVRFLGDDGRPGQLRYSTFPVGRRPPAEVTVAFRELRYRFLAPLVLEAVEPSSLAGRRGLAPTTRGQLARIDPSVSQVLLATVDLSGIDDPAGPLTSYDVDDSWIEPAEGDVSKLSAPGFTDRLWCVRDVVQSLLEPLRDHSSLILGYVVIQRTPDHAWSPTAARLSRFDDPRDDGRNTLDFVLATGGRALGPQDGLLQASLLPDQPDPGVQGVLGVSRTLFVRDVVQPILDEVAAALGLPGGLTAASDLCWGHTSSSSMKYEQDDALPATTWVTVRSSTRSCTVTLDNQGHGAGGGSSVRLLGTGTLSDHFQIDLKTALGTQRMGTVDSVLDFTFAAWLLAGHDGTILGGWQGPGSPTPRQTVTEDPVMVAEDKVGDLLAVQTVGDALNDASTQVAALESSAIGSLNLQAAELLNGLRASVCLPDAQAFFFKNLRLADDGGLRLELRYQRTTLD